MIGAHLETKGLQAGANLQPSEGLVVNRTGVNTVALAIDNLDDTPEGILIDGNTLGLSVTVAKHGLILVAIFGAAVAMGTNMELTYDGQGRLIPATVPGQWVVAHADLRGDITLADQQGQVRAVTPYRFAGRNNVPLVASAAFDAAADTDTVALGAEYANGVALAQFSEVDGTATQIIRASIDGAGLLTVTANAAATGTPTYTYTAYKPAA